MENIRKYRRNKRLTPEEFDFYNRICHHLKTSDYKKELLEFNEKQNKENNNEKYI